MSGLGLGRSRAAALVPSVCAGTLWPTHLRSQEAKSVEALESEAGPGPGPEAGGASEVGPGWVAVGVAEEAT